MNGRQMQNLNAAICDAFRDPATLGRAIFFATGTHLDSIAGPAALDYRVFEVIRWAEAHGQTAALVTGLRKENPGNALLRAFADDYLGTTSAPAPSTSTPTTPETTMPDLTTRTIHTDHALGFALAIADATQQPLDAAKKIRRRIFADDVTYAELSNRETFDRRTVERAIDKTLPDADIPEARYAEVVQALALVTPARRVCATCARLDLQRVAGRWSPQTGDYCLARVGGTECRGVLAGVEFDPDVVSWVDGSPHAPGTTHAPDGTPLTDEAIVASLHTAGSAVAPWTMQGITATEGALTLIALAGYLLRTGMVRNALGALDALADPRRAQIAATPDAMVILCRKALASRTAPPAPAATRTGGGAWDAARRKRLRDALATLFNTPARIAEQCAAAGISVGRVSLQGAPVDMWFSAISEAANAGRLDALLAVALAEYPRSFVLKDV